MHRKICTLIAFLFLSAGCAFGEVAIDEEHFPDSTFRAYVVTYLDINRDGVLSDSEIEGAETITLSNCFIGGGIMRVKSLKGIEYLTALKQLDCSLNGLTYLDLSKNKDLTYLDCSGNMLEKLDVSGCTALTKLNCNSNLLRELDVSSCKSLTNLWCSYNYIEKLDLRQNGTVLNKNGIDTYQRFNINGLTEISVNEEAYREARDRGEHPYSCWFSDYCVLSGLKIIPCGNDGYSNLYQINLNEYIPSNAKISSWHGYYRNEVNNCSGGFDSGTLSNGIVTFREFYSKEYMDVVRDTYEVDIHYTIGGFRDGNVRVYREAPAFEIYKAPVLEPLNVKFEVIEGKSDSDKIICSMDERHYYGRDGQALTEQSIADYPYSEYGKLGFAADGNSRLILRVKSDKPGYALFSFDGNGATGLRLERLKDRTEMLNEYSIKASSVEATEISNGVYQASAVLIAPESFPENKKFPSDKTQCHVIFITEESFDFDAEYYWYLHNLTPPDYKYIHYQNAEVKNAELKIEAAPVLLIPGMFDNAYKTFGINDNTGIYRGLKLYDFDETHIDVWDYDGSKGPNELLANDNNGLFKKLTDMFNQYASGGIVCTKADIVAHGLGGLMARKFLHESGKDSQDGNNWSVRSYKQGMVRRLITVAAPHNGTPWADSIVGKNFITAIYNGLLSSPFDSDHPILTNVLKPFTLINHTLANGFQFLKDCFTDVNSAWEELKTTAVRDYGFPSKVPMYAIAGETGYDGLIQDIKTSVTTMIDEKTKIPTNIISIVKKRVFDEIASYMEEKIAAEYKIKAALAKQAGNTGVATSFYKREVAVLKKGWKFKVLGKAAGVLSIIYDVPSYTRVFADCVASILFSGYSHDLVVSTASAMSMLGGKIYRNVEGELLSGNNDRYSHWSICQQLDVGLNIASLLKGQVYDFTTFDSEVYESANAALPASLGAFPDDIDESAEFEIAESLDLTVEPSVFALNTNSQTVKITLTSEKPLLNDVFCTFGNDDTCRFFKMSNADETRTKFEAAFNASALFASMDSGAIEFLCMSCISDDDGISGMYVSDTVSVNISGQTPAESVPPKITSAALEEGTVNMNYNAELKASGTPLIYWRITGGKLPDGLELSSFGKISGTPYQTGTFTFTAKAANTAGSVSHEFTLIIHTEDETAIAIDENTFPDENFRNYIIEKFDYDNDGKLTLNNIDSITFIDCSGRGIKSLKGIELFTALVYLTCTDNELTELDLSHNVNIYGVACHNNKLESINLANCSKLFQIWLTNNKISSIDFTDCPELNILSCNNNLLTTLDLSMCRNITELQCDEGVEILYNGTPGRAVLLIDANNFPDEIFRNFIADNFDSNKSGSLSDSEIDGIRAINVSNRGIKTLKGIEKLSSLEELHCEDNGITELDVSGCLKIKECWAINNSLTLFSADNCAELEKIGLHENKLTRLDVSSLAKLQELHCGDNLLETLTLGNKPVLLKLYCYRNNLKELNLEGCPALKELSFGDNKLSAIDITHCTELESLAFWDNFVTELDISAHMKLKDCIFGNNNVKTLTIGSKPELLRLHCFSNDLSSINITGCPALTDFNCMTNKISVLDVTKCKELETLYCNENLLKVLDLSECPKITELHYDDGVKLVYTHEAIAPEILTEILSNAVTGRSYSVQLLCLGATPIKWTHKGTLPKGLTLNESGLISGTPIKAGKSSFTVTAENSLGKISRAFTLQVFDPISITTASLKAGTIGKSYSVTMRAKGTKIITWSAEGFPSGLSMNEKGKISGKPSVYGVFNVKVKAENGAGITEKTLQLTVKAIAPKLSGSLKKATLNESYSSGLKVTGSTPIIWSVEGALSEGLTLDSSTGIISGTPTSYAKSGYKITITATNDAGKKSKKLTLKVNGKAPKITAKLPGATAGENYSSELSATGSEPITFVADLPEYLTLEGNTIAGNIPESAKNFKVKVYATNPVKTVSKTYTVKVIMKKKALPEDLNNDTGSTENESEGKIPGDNNNVEARSVTGITGNSSHEEQKSGIPDSYIIVAELGEISCDEPGMYNFDVELPDSVLEGSELVYIAKSDNPSSDDEIVEFYDGTGREISAVPENRRITISIWLNPETVYNPVIAVKD